MRTTIPALLVAAFALSGPPAVASWGPGIKGTVDSAAKKKPAKKDTKKDAKKKSDQDSGLGLDLSGGTGMDLSKPAAPPPPKPESATPAASPAPPPPAAAGKPPETDLSKPAPTPAPKPKDTKPAPTMTFQAIDVTGKSAERQKLDAAVKLFRDAQHETAAVALAQILKDPNAADMHVEAEYVLAKSLYRMGLYHSSLAKFRSILARGPSTKFFRTGLEWLFFIAHKTVNETIVLAEVAKYANFEFPERFRSEFRYLLAKYHFNRARALEDAGQQLDEAKKGFAEAKRLLALVPKNDSLYPRAKYLEATIHFRGNAFQPALDAYKDVVRVLNPRGGAIADPQLRELAFMQLARTHYGHRQNRYAIYYYDRIARGSDQWLEALFEASWAHFRIGQYEKALGNLITLSSPFFRDEYFPEALILKAVTYYENCRYREARAILDQFEGTYQPVHDELERITTDKDPNPRRFYDLLADIQKKTREDKSGSATILERILKLALTDKDLKRLNDSIVELETEMDALAAKGGAFRGSELQADLTEELKKQRESLGTTAGMMAKVKLENELSELKDLLAKGLRIRFETAEREKAALEEELKSGGKRDVITRYKGTVAVSDEHRYWPFEGEYWRDELGTYEYTLTKGCKEQQGRSGGDERASAQ